jgi:hypothetical protein
LVKTQFCINISCVSRLRGAIRRTKGALPILNNLQRSETI